MEQLIIPNEFNSYPHFCGVIVKHIFEQKNITGVIEEIDEETDFSNRIFITMEDGKEYIIRTWNIFDDDDNVYVDYTLFIEECEISIEL
jgi:hypothetical protein